ncbi:hypothetical protein MMC19_003404 [Ptychographa xylographoides]|nr:hypothetical protein [Ptychographa xylographoides]
MEPPKTAILFQNEEKTITLIDIPASIALGQVLPHQSLEQLLLSSTPLQEPYPSTEPKTEAARARVLARMGTENDAPDYSMFIRQGLQSIKDTHQTMWCLPRQILPYLTARKSKKRKARYIETLTDDDKHEQEPHISVDEIDAKLLNLSALSCTCLVDNGTVSIQNPSSITVQITISSSPGTYRIPPQAGVILGNINSKTVVMFGAQAITPYRTTAFAGSGQFDFVLLDPPWGNRSVKRGGIYKTMQEDDPLAAVSGILGDHIVPEGLVACWITNKLDARKAALSCFRTWNVELVEEWIWIKTTVKGDPVYDVNGLWRKPYEVLLVGRKSKRQTQQSLGSSPVNSTVEVPRKLIVGVSDLHSRKPCLKDMIEPMMRDPRKYRALELFARNMTAGWLAWGDEALKFNWSGHWYNTT